MVSLAEAIFVARPELKRNWGKASPSSLVIRTWMIVCSPVQQLAYICFWPPPTMNTILGQALLNGFGTNTTGAIKYSIANILEIWGAFREALQSAQHPPTFAAPTVITVFTAF